MTVDKHHLPGGATSIRIGLGNIGDFEVVLRSLACIYKTVGELLTVTVVPSGGDLASKSVAML